MKALWKGNDISGEQNEQISGWQSGSKEDWLWIPSNSKGCYRGRQPLDELAKRVETRKSATRRADIWPISITQFTWFSSCPFSLFPFRLFVLQIIKWMIKSPHRSFVM